MRRFAVLLAALSLFIAGCDRGGSPSRAEDATAEPSTPTVTSSPAASSPQVTLSIADPLERERISTALAELTVPPGIEVSDQLLADGRAYLIEAWAAVTDQRRDVLELTLDELQGVITGEITNWVDLGGSPMPISVEVPARGGDGIARQLAPSGLGTAVIRKEQDDVLVDAEERPGTLALIPLQELRPGVLAFIVDGYDPYRDAATSSPLRIERWVKASDEATADEVARRVGWNAALAAFNPASVLATGDYIPARCSWSSAVAAGGSPVIFSAPGMRDLMRAADLTVVPLEVGLMTSNPPTPCTPTTVLQGPASAVDALVDAGVDIVTRASNHSLDCWEACSGLLVMQETNEVLAQAGIPSTGLGNDSTEARTATVVERDGIRFGILAYDDIAQWYHAAPGAAGTAGLDLATLADDVRAAKALADHVLVAISAGIEYQAEPTDRQREAARIGIEAGATLVIGNHPHWVQAMEQIGEGFVVYALGNFVFDQPWSVPTQQGMLLEAGFTRERMIGYRLRPHIIQDNYRPTLLDLAGEGAPILQRVWEASDLISGR